jgi:hypothetical protein
MCRTYNEYASRGWSFTMQDKMAPIEHDDRVVGSARAALEASGEVWSAEVQADKIAEREVIALLAGMTEVSNPDYASQLIADFVGDMSLLAMWYWYRRVDAFMSRTCEAEMTARFGLTRCLCGSIDRWRMAAGMMLSETHPPFLLRAATSVLRLLGSLHVAPTPQTAAAVVFLYGFQRGAMAVAYMGCEDSLVAASPGGFFEQMPALEGMKTVEDGKVLMSNPAETTELMSYCRAQAR